MTHDQKDTTGGIPPDYTIGGDDQAPPVPEVNVTIHPNFYQDNLISRLDQLIQVLIGLGEVLNNTNAILMSLVQKIK